MGMGIIGMSFMFPLLAMGGGDLLNQIPVQDYWQQRGISSNYDTMLNFLDEKTEPVDATALIRQLGDVDYQVRDKAAGQLEALGRRVEKQLQQATEASDPEVRFRAKELLKKLGSNQHQRHIHRLMAIRTLGEMKDPRALPHLKKLLDSNRNFEADYARQAIATIESKPLPARTINPALMSKHLWMLPKECGYVAQARNAEVQGTRISDMFKLFGEMGAGDQVAEMKREFYKGLLEAADRIGNVRLDSITVGVAENVGDDSGFVVLIARGLYNKAAIESFIKEEFVDDPEDIKPTGIEGVSIYQPESEAAIIPVSNELLIAMFGPNEEKLPIKAVIEAVKTGKGTLSENAAMVDLIQRADTAKPIWGAARLTDHLWKEIGMDRTLMPVGTLQDFHFHAEIGAKKSRLVAIAQGKEAANVEASGLMIKTWVNMGAQFMKQNMNEAPPTMKPKLTTMIQAMEGLQCQSKDKTLTVTAEYPGNMAQDIIVMPAMMFLSVTRQIEHMQQAIPDQH